MAGQPRPLYPILDHVATDSQDSRWEDERDDFSRVGSFKIRAVRITKHYKWNYYEGMPRKIEWDHESYSKGIWRCTADWGPDIDRAYSDKDSSRNSRY